MKIKCPACSQVLNIPDAAAGKVVKCPCGKQLRAPGGPAKTGAPVAATPRRPTAGPAGQANPSAAPPRRPAAVSNDFDPGMFDELTTGDLQPVRAVGQPGRPASSNPYAPSGGGGHGSSGSFGGPIASVWKRFLGSFVDGLMFMVAFGIGMGLVAAMGAAMGQQEPTPVMTAVIMVVMLFPVALVLALNAVLVTKSGQTVGKKAVGTRIVMQDTRELPGFIQGWLLRSLVFGIANQFIPFLAFIDGCFVFTENARMLHDRIAGTVVIDV
ncbi:RDD family protein [Rubripirellula lacrimiformis]|uniref:RDD family protein n=1 Tax=Rubripirellula lacrimiformis TaxID=1930273 RepID=A0A517NC96_9BACT|nr:RDD family protein [Rubripirellula lacrimiformis]QDT04757.1 RDD family protein [Rubripirellula lacrimiformis]